MATARTETTCGPTYSMTRAIGATPGHGKKVLSVDAIVCATAHSRPQWKSLVTHRSHGPTSPMATSHIDEHVGESATPV